MSVSGDPRLELLDEARSGDKQALGDLLESFRPYVAFIARARGAGRLRGKFGESDLVQNALLNAYRGFSAFRGSTVEEFAGWLRQIAKRTTGQALRDHLDVEKRDAGREQAVDGLSGIATPDGSTPSAKMIRYETSAKVALAIANLPDDMQLVLLGRHVDRLGYDVLACRLGRTEAAIRVLYTRALRRIRDECES